MSVKDTEEIRQMEAELKRMEEELSRIEEQEAKDEEKTRVTNANELAQLEKETLCDSEEPGKGQITPAEKAKIQRCCKEICDGLKERNASFVRDIVMKLGVGMAEEILKETIRLDLSGEVFVKDGTRRKSPGGIFFGLARDKLGGSLFARMATQDTKRRKKLGRRLPVSKQCR